MLRHTTCTLYFIGDSELFSMADVGIRGALSMISNRHALANKPSLAAFDPARPTSYISYLEGNNLYGWAMSKPMPIVRFEWMTAADALEIDWLAKNENQPAWSFNESSIPYPVALQEAQNYYRLAPERLEMEVKL